VCAGNSRSVHHHVRRRGRCPPRCRPSFRVMWSASLRSWIATPDCARHAFNS
jgi:hypothetical protein